MLYAYAYAAPQEPLLRMLYAYAFLRMLYAYTYAAPREPLLSMLYAYAFCVAAV